MSSVVAIEIPIDPPTLRIRLNKPLALPIWVLRSVPLSRRIDGHEDEAQAKSRDQNR